MGEGNNAKVENGIADSAAWIGPGACDRAMTSGETSEPYRSPARSKQNLETAFAGCACSQGAAIAIADGAPTGNRQYLHYTRYMLR